MLWWNGHPQTLLGSLNCNTFVEAVWQSLSRCVQWPLTQSFPFKSPSLKKEVNGASGKKNQEVYVLSTCALGLPLQAMKELIIWTFYSTRGEKSKEKLFANCFITLLCACQAGMPLKTLDYIQPPPLRGLWPSMEDKCLHKNNGLTAEWDTL